MNQKVRDAIIDAIQHRQDAGTSIMHNQQTLPLRAEFINLTPTPCPSSCFVDGGNAVLLATPDMCVQHIRVAAVCFAHQQCVQRVREDFYVLITNTGNDVFSVANFNMAFSCGPFDGKHEDLRQGSRPAQPERIGELVRRIAELELLARMSQNLSSASLLVLDGELEAQTVFEQPFLEQAMRSAGKRMLFLAGLSKTSRLLTNTGQSALAVLAQQGPPNAWLYAPAQQSKPATGVVKLHAKSNHVFRLDTERHADMQMVASQLATFATDAQLPGYPYGLIAADQLAKISVAEARVEQQAFMAVSEKSLKPFLAALDAHQYF